MCLKIVLVWSWEVETSIPSSAAFQNRSCQAWMTLGGALGRVVECGAQVLGCAIWEVMERLQWMEGLVSEPSGFHRKSRVRKNFLAWHIACLVFLKGEHWVAKTTFGCIQECEWKGFRLYWAEFEVCIHFLPQLRRGTMGRFWVFKVQPGQIPCSLLAPLPLAGSPDCGFIRMELGWQWAAGLSASQ